MASATMERITMVLRRWDAASSAAPWTLQYREPIAANEAVRAPEFAATVGQQTPRFERRVLTISLEVGCRISLRGRAFLAQ